MGDIDWNLMLTVDNEWAGKNLNHHFNRKDLKVVFRSYSIKMSGNTLKFDSLADELAELVTKYVYSKKEILAGGEQKSYRNAIKYFGIKDPSTDGKFGELFLYALVESVLECPMIAHKLRSLTNFSDQVKGGDGIFMGKYKFGDSKEIDACLIGESKIMQNFSDGVKDALESIDRFHSGPGSEVYTSTEYIVAREHLSDNAVEHSQAILSMLNPTSEEFHKNTVIHPVFIMYNTPRIDTIEKKAINKSEAEEEITKYWNSRSDATLKLINDQLDNFPNLQKVILDFFLIPVNSVENFRNTLYYQLHGVPFKK